jgi:glyoxylase-like metal-dependent hydrolase (beta-lactamase superfamily II)
MKKMVSRVLVLIFGASLGLSGAPPRFEKVSDHYYSYQCKSDGLNVGAVVSDDGILIINPPGDPDLSEALDALKRVSPHSVRWVVITDYRIALAGGAARLAEQGAVVIGCEAMRPLLAGARDQKAPEASTEGQVRLPEPPTGTLRLSIAFGRQIHLFPGGLEVRIFGLQSKARTAADVAVFIPAEKVLQLGDLYNLGSYPEIDDDQGGGSAAGWIDGIKQVVDAVPLLKPAIPPSKTAPSRKSPPPKSAMPAQGAPAAEKTPEEELTVVTGHGPLSNLMELKGLLETARKLRAEVSKLVADGIEREKLLSSPGLSSFRVYNGFDQYASQLFDALSKK